MSKTKSENIVPDDLILCRKHFKKSLPGQTVNVMGKDYATVAHRVAVVRECLGGRASITSEILHNDKDTCVVRTTFTIDGKVVSTGLAEEKKNASRINQTSALENCETSAVGRALAMAGITNDKIASAEEVSAAIEQQSTKTKDILKELQSVSHLGNYQKWITDHKAFLADMKWNNPLSYDKFMSEFATIKSQLKSKGVLQ